MTMSSKDLFAVLCAVALAAGVAACDAPDESRTGQGGARERASHGPTPPSAGGGLEHRGDVTAGTDLPGSEPAPAPAKPESGAASESAEPTGPAGEPGVVAP